jgi:hypothetical protein
MLRQGGKGPVDWTSAYGGEGRVEALLSLLCSCPSITCGSVGLGIQEKQGFGYVWGAHETDLRYHQNCPSGQMLSRFSLLRLGQFRVAICCNMRPDFQRISEALHSAPCNTFRGTNVFDFFSSIIDLLKASRWQTGAIAFTAGLFLYLSNSGVLPGLHPWIINHSLRPLFQTAMDWNMLSLNTYSTFQESPQLGYFGVRYTLRSCGQSALAICPHIES